MRCCAVLGITVASLVGLFAVLVGCVVSGNVPQSVFRYIDEYESARGPRMKGLLPAFHNGIPWGFTEEDMPDLSNHVSIVTGANVGLGYWTVYHLAKAGDTVVLACRTPSKCTAAVASLRQELGPIRGPAAKLTPMELDLSSFASIRAFSKAFTEEFTSLNSLVLNAGVMMPPFTTTKEGLEMQIGTNHFGHHLLTSLLLPTLETTAAASGVGTIAVVSSSAHYSTYPEGIRLSIDALNNETKYEKANAYGQSKLANVLFAQELAVRLESKSILVNSIHPGVVDTDLGRHLLDALENYAGKTISQFVADYVMPKAGSGTWHPKDAALTQVFATVAPSLIAAKTTGKYFHPIARETTPDPHAANATLQRGLWALTEAFIASH